MDEESGAGTSRECEIDEVRREEASRGRRRPYAAAVEERKREDNQRVRELLAHASEAEFADAIIERGLQRGTAEFRTAMNAFRTVRQWRRSRP